MNCPNCKNPIQEDVTECEWCGVKIESKNNLNKTENLNNNSNLDPELLELLEMESSEKNGQAKTGGCFIATACYGDYESPEVKEFRRFRDNVLVKYYFGRLFISSYYFISPTFADIISKSDKTKRIIRKVFLIPILYLIKK